ncbi:MAG TPA: methionyl-tRNA formyltransferase [Bacteroidia bacterium]|nr:methionyl-tRNA formyltransferase [Bacteroidia bacterium]
MKIIFFGTPKFAVASLLKMLEAGFEVVAVVTAPDKPAGRGLKMQASDVKQFALEKKLPVLQPEKLKNPEFISQLKSYNADLFVIIAFRMLPEMVWNMPPLGSINLHGSLLPQYRGAAPINRAIMNGEKETGVTTFFLKHEVDTGSIILREKVKIDDNDTAGTLHDKLMEVGAGLVVKTLQVIKAGNYILEEQDVSQETKHAPKIFKEDCKINWNKTVEENYNFIRGLSPYPTAWTMLDNLGLKIFFAEKKYNEPEKPGTIATDSKTYFRIACTDGWLSITDLQLEGKKRMGVEDFLGGFNLSNTQK